jgi:acetylornithine deacetylase/succinyl-diaminopimelate desuccinylase-like protein
VPFLGKWGTPLLCGPGSILLAHTDREHLPLDELDAAVDGYERLARHCLSAVDPS